LTARNIIRRREVKRRTGYSDTTIWRGEQAGKFPRRVLLNPDAGPKGGVGWFEDEIDEWVHNRVRGVNRPLPIQRKPKPMAPSAGAEAIPCLLSSLRR
jgi:predicted DNA-binding transcriptional regulator AlpA